MKTAHRVTVIALLWLMFVNPGSITNLDTERRLNMSHAWWTRTEESFSGNKVVININGKNYVPYDLGQSMLMLPGDWLGEKLGQNIDNEKERQYFREAVVSFLIFLPINLLAVLTCFKFLQLVGYSERIAGLSSIVWLLGTSVLFYSSFHQQNNQILLFVLISYQAALAYVLKDKKSLAILSGASLGVAFLIRITSILYAVSVLIFLIGCVFSKRKLKSSFSRAFKALTLWMTGFVPFILLERILTYVRYGDWTATSTSLHLQIYSKASSLGDPNAIVEGANKGFSFLKLLTKVQPEALLAPLFSPEKSIFLYDPLVLPCLILFFICQKFLSQYIKWYVTTVIISFILHTYIYSWTSNWITDGVWGARYHITLVHLLLVPLIPLLVRGAMKQAKNININSSQLALRSIARIIIVVAILIQFASISLDFSLEATQHTLGVGSRFYIVQRFDNIFAKIDRADKNSLHLPKIKDSADKTALKNKLRWDFLPFLYQNDLKNDSSLNKFMPVLFGVWALIFIFAAITTAWIFFE
ncbi:glycosyltransferase family 39 protein [Pleurocapsa sp. FMAR1]|uniref:glycosyltransferase family 39 protein n=1 Tax=Pleurocapsa sp. FMAR1 TaxID=3040204 RepID=UPI0029C9AEA6|nr:glycosyltransferase family 39 protein [Pleurocapsa sp. FMAR1]